MNYTHDKILYLIGSVFSSGFAALGAIMSPQESRWFFVTMAVSIMTSFALSLTFRRNDETIRLVIGRSTLAVLGGIFITKPAVWWFNIDTAHTDVVALGGISAACCTFSFILGLAALEYLMKKRDQIAKGYIEGKLSSLNPPKDREP